MSSEFRSWEAYAGGHNPDEPPTTYGDFLYVSLYGPTHMFKGRLIEDPEGDLRGWLDSRDEGTDALPSMIYHHKIFGVCFPYGVEAEVKAGYGTVIKLRWERDL